ncbi:transglycosylase domain-containing protein [Rapidithrix thailandica]|uniref:Transglycosylase domain-containing protein n=1 Tax=Rapidithrix thailandica TaxID=413964 RepID=A0AAW9RTY2_9BACT
MYSKITRILWIVFGAGILGFILLLVSVNYNWFNLYGAMPDFKVLENPKSELASEVYTADGVLLGKYYRENRTPVSFEELSPNLLNALMASEDIRFYDHPGIDLKGIFSIPYYLFIKGKKRGASTITQQLAKILFKTRRTEEYEGALSDVPGLGMVIIKIKEWILAIRLEKAYTKREIISMYLNTFEFGSNAFGIKVASKTFFNTSPDSLNLQEAATLVGMLQNPSRYSPVFFPENSLIVRNDVIDQMVRYNYLEAAAADSLKQLEIDVSEYSVDSHNTGLATYFRAEIKKDLLKWQKEKGIDIYADGLKIYTTIDSRMQKYAEEAMEKHMSYLQELFFEHWKGRNPWVDERFREIPGLLNRWVKQSERYRKLKAKYGNNQDSIDFVMNKKTPMKVFSWEVPGYRKDTVLSPIDSVRYMKHILHAGMMSIDPYNGHVKAWVGGINNRFFKYDHVRQGYRQPGSVFKPIIYTAAIEDKGFHPCFKLVDVPIAFTLPSGKVWKPKNFGKYSGETFTLRQALAQSKNTIAAYLMKELGPQRVVDYAENRFGFKYIRDKYDMNAQLEAVPSLCLGTSDVSVFEMVAAYGTFVNHGIWTEPIYLTRIEDKNGNVIQTFVPKTIEALSEETAYIMTYMLRGSTEEKNGTSQRLWRYDFKQGNEIGGKTGTTSNYSDGWYMGVSKDLVTGVWVGGEERSVHFRSGQYGQGARLAMPIFSEYMEKVYADKDLGYTKGEFPKPSQPLSIELDCNVYNQKMMLVSDSTNNYVIPNKVQDQGIL